MKNMSKEDKQKMMQAFDIGVRISELEPSKSKR
jgi:hypothetical protein